MSRYKIMIGDKCQGGSFASKDSAESVAQSLRAKHPGASVVAKQEPPPEGAPDGDMEAAFEELKAKCEAAEQRAATAEAKLAKR